MCQFTCGANPSYAACCWCLMSIWKFFRRYFSSFCLFPSIRKSTRWTKVTWRCVSHRLCSITRRRASKILDHHTRRNWRKTRRDMIVCTISWRTSTPCLRWDSRYLVVYPISSGNVWLNNQAKNNRYKLILINLTCQFILKDILLCILWMNYAPIKNVQSTVISSVTVSWIFKWPIIDRYIIIYRLELHYRHPNIKKLHVALLLFSREIDQKKLLSF